MAERTSQLVYRHVCENKACGKPFVSKKPDRKYCTVKCYAATPEFKARARATLEKARKQYKPAARKGAMRPCLHCGALMYLKPSEIKRGKKTCSRAHYRAYMAGRFDRAIAAPVAFKDMQGYDEYLTQDKLPCLVEGCSWAGDNLGLHMNQAHGITADDFKRLAGFNLSTGLVSQKMEAHLVARANRGTPRTLDRKKALAGRKFDYVALERKEHAQKAALLRQRDAAGRWAKEG